MAKKRPEGECHICGVIGPLSFEHIPPRAAYNDRPVISITFEQALSIGPDDTIKGPKQNRGMGGYTLCERCNNVTGGWYGEAFVEWCYQGMDILHRTGGRPTLIYLNYLLPLRILKQIVTMLFSVNGPRFRTVNEELVRFVLNKQARYLSPRYRFFVYYNIEGRLRASGGTGVMDIQTGRRSIMSEITFPPFGYVMTIDSEPPDPRLVEITQFARFDYDEFAVFPLRIPVLPTHTVVPGDYRDRAQIYREAGLDPSVTNHR